MLTIPFFKGNPSKFIIKKVSGKVKKKGIGLSFRYFAYNTNIISIPATTVDAHFIFNEVSKDFQLLTLQGHFTYRIKDALKMDSLLDFSINPMNNLYISEDPEKLELRIKNVVQMATRTEIKELHLEEALAFNTTLATTVINEVKSDSLLEEMGIELLSITFNSIKPTPEISKALEAEYREQLQRQADKSIYERRASAVEQERKIRENELKTQITLELKKQELIELNGKNIIDEADYKAKAKDLELNSYKAIDPKTLLALSFNELASKANKIGNLTITSEILASILQHN